MTKTKRLGASLGLLFSALLLTQTGCLPGMRGGPPGLPGLPGLPGPHGALPGPNRTATVAAAHETLQLASNEQPDTRSVQPQN